MVKGLNWHFERELPMGGAAGEGWLNPLAATGLPTEYVLAREAIQNSADAHRDDVDRCVRVVFRKKRFIGKSKERFVEVAALAAGLKPRVSKLNLARDNALEHLSDLKKPLEILLIEDWNTQGLGGSLLVNGPEAHFRKLLLMFGVGDKARENAERGGSYGYGKSVYSATSDINTIICYSVFEPTAETKGSHARLMGCAYFASHEHRSASYTGRAWLGVPTDRPDVFHPLTDGEAHDFAKQLELGVRSREQTGLTIAIVGTHFDLNKLREGIEQFWWPKLQDHELDVEIWDGDKTVEPPRPMRRNDLRPFIECYDAAKGISAFSGERERCRELRAIDSRKTGTWAAKALDKDTIDPDDTFCNSIALIRRAKMVVEYRKIGMDHLEPILGAFVAHESIDNFLKLSEPPAHNQWDAGARRLDEDGKKIVEHVARRLKDGVRQFQKSLMPPVPPGETRLKALERQLGSFLKVSKKGPPSPIPHPDRDPVEIHIHEGRENRDGMAVVTADVKIRLRSTAAKEKERASIVAKLDVLANDNHSVDGTIELSAEADDPSAKINENGEATIEAVIAKQSFLHIRLESSAFDPNWATKLSIGAEQIDG